MCCRRTLLLGLGLVLLALGGASLAGADDCCVDRGNIDDLYGPVGPVDIADLTYFVAYLFLGGPEPPCLEAADVNGDGEINIADMTCMVEWLVAPDKDAGRAWCWVPCP